MSGSVTPNFRLQKPPFDTIPWDQAINGNMDTIDAALGQCLPIANFMGTWKNATSYSVAQVVVDGADNTMWQCAAAHVSATAPTTFYQDRTAHPFNWTATTNAIGGSVAITLGDAPPSSAKQGDLWYDTASGQLFVYYNDGTSIQWVVSINQPGNLADAPNDGNLYGRQSAAWTVIGGGIASVGRNYLHNPLFNVAQRGTAAFTTTNTYPLDRWRMDFALDTMAVQQIAATDTQRTQSGDEAVTNLLFAGVTGNAGAGAFSALSQNIEDVRRLGGKTVTVSFWAYATAGTPKIGVAFQQMFGTGGSPSASVLINGTPITISTTMTRYSVTVALPSIVGKTVGTNNDSSLRLALFFSSGATNNAFAGGIGVQTANFLLWGVQLEVGSVATPLEKPDPQQDLAKCQRFFQAVNFLMAGYATAGLQFGGTRSNAVPMRAVPTPTIDTNSSSNITPTLVALGGDGVWIQGGAVATGQTVINIQYHISADL